MASKIAVNKPNSYLLLNGDEAVARGAIEAGIKVAAAYPGTPSTEILETIAEVAKQFGIYAEWSINEIVAVEVAVGASMAGVAVHRLHEACGFECGRGRGDDFGLHGRRRRHGHRRLR